MSTSVAKLEQKGEEIEIFRAFYWLTMSLRFGCVYPYNS